MSDEPDWSEFYQHRQRSHADAYLAFAQAHAQRDPVAHDQLQAELVNLFSAAGWLRKQADWPGLVRLSAALWEESSFLPDRGPTPQALPVLEGGLEAARALDDAAAIGARLNALGETLRALGQIEPAIALHNEALTLAREAGDLTTVRAALCHLGQVWIDRDVSKALPHLAEAEKIPGAATDPAMEIDLLNALATAHTQQRQNQPPRSKLRGMTGISYPQNAASREESDPLWIELAASYLDRALSLAQEEQDVRRQAELLHKRGYLRMVSNDLQNARSDFQEAADWCKKIAHFWGRGRALNAMGGLAVRMGQIEQGVAELEQALQVHRQVGDEGMMPFTLVALGEGYLHLGDFETAQGYLEQASEIVTAFMDIPHVAALEAAIGPLLEYIHSQ